MVPLYKPEPDVSKNFDAKNVNDYVYGDTEQLVEFNKELKNPSNHLDYFGKYFYQD